MTTLFESLRSASAADRGSFRPLFFRLNDPADRVRLEALLKQRTDIAVHDHLHGQLTELVRSLNPSIIFAKDDLDRAGWAHLKGVPADEYGVWVFYPWSKRLVHLLDEAEFTLVRTDRNRNKITRREQELLATKKVGVIGLSVGQSVSLTMAQERSFGELRLADFDTLELSNLNRIRSGVHLLGTNKVVNTAREIAEIDPFLKVTCFQEGITPENIERFLTENGELDLLIEECDSVAVKVIARQKAREHRIPVVMDTSDRGLVDVERFDLEPERPILHGLVDHLDLSLAAKAKTNEEKLPFVVPIIGLDTMSTRMKASMLEIESTVTTWPQLGSAVVMGGGIVGHIARRILLGQKMPSGRWWLDPDDLLGVGEEVAEATPGAIDEVEIAAQHTLDRKGMIAAADRLQAAGMGLELSVEEAEALAEAGAMAPSGGNCQPWKFLHHNGRLFLFLDGDRARSALDPGLRYAMLGMGACAENMILEAGRSGIGLDHQFAPLQDVPQLIAVLGRSTDQADDLLQKANRVLADRITDRCTNRKFSETLLLADEEAKALTAAANDRYPLAPVTLIRERSDIERIAVLCGAAERIRFLNPTCHKDMFAKEMRWSDKEVQRTRDGIDVATLELSIADRTGLRVAADQKAVSLLRHWNIGNVMEKLTAKNIRASNALAIVSIPDLGLASAYMGGRAMERFWLQAAAMGLLAHPVGAPIFMGLHGHWDDQGILTEQEHQEAGTILDELKRIMGSTRSEPFFMLRLGRAGEPSARSLRLPLNSVFHSTMAVTACATRRTNNHDRYVPHHPATGATGEDHDPCVPCRG